MARPSCANRPRKVTIRTATMATHAKDQKVVTALGSFFNGIEIISEARLSKIYVPFSLRSGAG